MPRKPIVNPLVKGIIAEARKPWPARYADLDALYAISRQETETHRLKIDDLTTALDESRERVRQANDAKITAQNEAKELRERLDELKALYADCRFENAVMTGYLDRVYEDDVVRDPVIEVADQDQNPAISRTQSKRPQRLRTLGMQRPMPATTDRAYMDRFSGGRKRPDHWAQY